MPPCCSVCVCSTSGCTYVCMCVMAICSWFFRVSALPLYNLKLLSHAISVHCRAPETWLVSFPLLINICYVRHLPSPLHCCSRNTTKPLFVRPSLTATRLVTGYWHWWWSTNVSLPHMLSSTSDPAMVS